MAITRREGKVRSSLESQVATRSTGVTRTPLEQQQPEVDFLTLVGPLTALERVIDQWQSLAGAANVRLTTPPRILPLPPAAEEYADQAVLRVAVVRHASNLGPALVRRLRIQLDTIGLADVHVEEGYFLSSGGSSKMTGNRRVMTDSWSVNWEPRHIEALCRNFEVKLMPSILGAAFVRHWNFPCKISLIDTGDEGSTAQTGFDSELTAPEPPSDHDGHGTSVGSLIRMIAPHVELHSYRVLRSGDNFVESAILLNAITSAMMTIGMFQIVVIPQRANLSVRSLGQHDAIHYVIRQNAQNSHPTPVMICAAGNSGSRESMSYPATVPGVVVAVALDWSGRVADYNCSPPAKTPVFTAQAFGGIERDPIGHIGRPGRSTRYLYGSSYAAGLVAGALASQVATHR
jgi:Subtilase family